MLGGTINQCVKENAPSTIINHDSDVSVVCGATDWREISPHRHVMVEERRRGTTRKLKWAEFPKRQGSLIAVPLYVGRARVD